MLAPDLKNGAGGLRDVQSAGWVGWALGPDAGAPTGWAGGVGTLVDRGYLQAGDPARLAAAGARMLEACVALHRVTKGKSDQLALQDQDEVARLVGADDADVLLRGLGESARAVTWITSDLWARLLASEEGPRHRVTGLRDLGDGITLRDGRIAFATDRELDGTRVLVLAARAAEQGAQFERDTLNRIAAVEIVEWTDDARAAFIALLGTGRNAIGVFETLDHVGVLVRLLPEWEHVRARPQRNAYHRFTVDRHSLEAVAECAALLDPADPVGAGSDGDVARRARADVLLLSALLHDIGKGYPGDHSDVGVAIARDVATRIRLDDAGIEELTWLVQHHLLLADTGTRRDLNDEVTIRRFARTVGDAERLDLLYALTLADSRATGPAAWSSNKAQLLRELWVKTNAALEDGTVVSAPVAEHRAALRTRIGDDADEYLDAMPASYAAAFSPEELAWHRERLLAGELVMEWRVQSGPSLMCTVVAPDRTGLLATVAGTLALLGFDISAASGYSHRDGMAIEVFSGTDRFERFATDADRARATETLASALDGTLALDEQLAERTRRYRTASASEASDVRVIVDLEASTFATVVEVHAPDDVGLLARVAAVFAALDLDVSQAIVSTVGDRVVDVFYLRDSYGQKFTDPEVLDSLRASVLTHVTSAA